jgi:hypothetical protein
MMPINKSLTLEKKAGEANKEDGANEAALLAQLIRRLQVSELKFNKALTSISRGQHSILQTLEENTPEDE